MKQTEALKLAEALDDLPRDNNSLLLYSVAAELRRLHEVNQELLVALQALLNGPDGKTGSEYGMVIAQGYAAIAKATGGQA